MIKVINKPERNMKHDKIRLHYSNGRSTGAFINKAVESMDRKS